MNPFRVKDACSTLMRYQMDMSPEHIAEVTLSHSLTKLLTRHKN
jgi:hypothetical protein